MTLSWNELACHGLLKKIPEREVVALVMIHLRPMRIKWVKDHGTGEVEKYIMDNEMNCEVYLAKNKLQVDQAIQEIKKSIDND